MPDPTETGTTEAEDDRPRRIAKAEINQLPLIAWTGRTDVLDTAEAMREAAASLADEPVLGFDTETRPTFRKGEYYPPALIQLATPERVCLFRICKTESFEPLRSLLEAERPLKAGVGIRDDVKELRAVEAFEPGGFVEIADITAKLGYENRGLRPLAALLLGGRISKAAQVSNWARAKLDDKQIRYAATDAWISLELYRKVMAERPEGS